MPMLLLWQMVLSVFLLKVGIIVYLHSVMLHRKVGYSTGITVAGYDVTKIILLNLPEHLREPP